jgi:hypothetical protein
MKTILSVILTITLVSSSVVASPSYNNTSNTNVAVSTVTAADIFGKVFAHRQQNGVSLNWTVINSQDVVSFVIERSWDGVYFDAIDEVAVTEGINRYRDNDIYPGYLYYRIIAVMSDGTEVCSSIEMVRIVKHG